MKNEVANLTTGDGKVVQILNLMSYPVTVNDSGQTIPGMGEARVDADDAVLATAVKAGFVRIIPTTKD